MYYVDQKPQYQQMVAECKHRYAETNLGGPVLKGWEGAIERRLESGLIVAVTR